MDLTEALDVRQGDVVALVGGGGKTTAMYRLCVEAAARGLRAVASGTARFTEPSGGAQVPLLVESDETALVLAVTRALEHSPWVIAASGHGTKERLLPITDAVVDRLHGEPAVDLLVLEADGSAMRAFKAPAEHEPAVPPSATLVVAVVGADTFGRPLTEELVHRPERVSLLTGLTRGAPISPEAVATVLGHPDGGRKAVPAGARFAVLINKLSDARLEPARQAAELLQGHGVSRVVLAHVREEPPVVEVFVG